MSSPTAAAQCSETTADLVREPSSRFDASLTTADIVVETLIAWGATRAFGIVGDSVNSVIEALRKCQDRIRHIGLILGSTMPWFEYYPTPGQARVFAVVPSTIELVAGFDG